MKKLFVKPEVKIDWRMIEKKVDGDIENEVKEMITQIQGGTTNGQ